MNLIKLFFLSLLAMLLAACGGPSQGGGDGGETLPAIVSLQLTPATATVPAGFGIQYVAQATLSDDSVMDVTTNPAVHWSTSDPAVATIDNAGFATGVAPGEVTIIASGTAKNGPFERKVTLTVTNAVVSSLQVTPVTASTPVGLEQAFTAIAIFSDSSQIDVTSQSILNWSSSDPAIATIENNRAKKGHATGVTPGTATITASLTASGQEHSADATLTITDATITKLRVEPQTVNTPVSVPAGLSLQFHAIATFSDGHELDVTGQPTVSWSTDNAAIAIVDNAANKGLALGVAPGDVIVTATGTANDKTLSATGTLKVTNATVLGLSITPFNRHVPAGFSRPFTATASLSDGTSLDVTTNSALSWSSSDPAIVTIENNRAKKGQATGVIPGAVTITASGTANHQSFSATTPLTVTDALLVDIAITPETAVVVEGTTKSFLATGTFSDTTTSDISNLVMWSSDNTAVATIDATGVATGITPGKANISASKDGINSNSVNVEVISRIPNYDLGCTMGTVENAGSIYTCPLTQEEAKLRNIQYDEVILSSQTGTRNTYVLMNLDQANNYCNYLGADYRLPSKDELIALFDAHGDMNVYAGWPVYATNTEGYMMNWSSTPYPDRGTNYLVNLADGWEASDSSGNAGAAFVSCVQTLLK